MADSIKEFYQEFMEAVKDSANSNATTSEQQFTEDALEYIREEGLAVNPDIVDIVNRDVKKPTDTGYYKITAFDYSEDAGTLDLFTTAYQESDTVYELKKGQIDQAHNWAVRFFFASLENDDLYNKYLKEDPDIAEIIYTIKSEYKSRNIQQLRIFILSNGHLKEEYTSSEKIDFKGQELDLEVIVWDIKEIYKSDSSMQNDNGYNIDLEKDYKQSIPCLEVEESPAIKSYLAVMPASILAQVYSTYGARLLNQNVRTYLGGRVKVNRGMADSIKQNPTMFFAYNNGISSTASAVETKIIDGRTVITGIRDWQIVNGGQTTNTICNCDKNHISLEGVSLALKISEIKSTEADRKAESIADIARYANSQSAIKESDFSSNQTCMTSLEKLSRNEWAPITSKRSKTQWFFERMRGQYDMSKGKPRSSKSKEFINTHPKKQVFTKADIAKIEMAWNGQPFSSSMGAEKCFNKYWKEYLSKDPSKEVDSTYFHNLVAKFIIAEAIKDEFVKADLKGYGNIVVNYVLAIISEKANNRLDLGYIWDHQEINPLLMPFIKAAIDVVHKYIIKVAGDGINVSTVAKKFEFWNNIKQRIADLSLDSSLFSVDTTLVMSDEDNELLDEFKQKDASVWIDLSVWGKANRKLSLLERKKVERVYAAVNDGKEVDFSLVSDVMEILRKSKRIGF